MFGFETKTVVISTAVILSTAAAAVGAVLWFTRDQWKADLADKTIEDLVDAYNQAIADFPDNRNRAIFAFEIAAAEIKRVFSEEFGQYEEHEAWVIKFDTQVKHLKKAFHK